MTAFVMCAKGYLYCTKIKMTSNFFMPRMTEGEIA